MSTTLPTMLIFTTSMLQLPKMNIPSLYVKEAPYLELSMLERHHPWNMTHCIPTSSTNLSITYTMITAIKTQTHIIGVTISKSLQEVLLSDLY